MKELEKLRLDKWLWAARFFKTRTIAKAAIEGGKVHFNGQRVKVSKEIQVGDELKIRQGFDEKIVIVKALNDKRRPASEAQLLYSETEASMAKREDYAEQRKQLRIRAPESKPNKKDRRQLQQAKQHLWDS
jgi:ribosome-associated heat shock protein Hsp15